MREEGIVGEYLEVGKYGIDRFVMYNIVSKVVLYYILPIAENVYNEGNLTYTYLNT
jgi:hypothetical protein